MKTLNLCSLSKGHRTRLATKASPEKNINGYFGSDFAPGDEVEIVSIREMEHPTFDACFEFGGVIYQPNEVVKMKVYDAKRVKDGKTGIVFADETLDGCHTVRWLLRD